MGLFVCFPQLLRVNVKIKRLGTNGTNDIEPNLMKSLSLSFFHLIMLLVVSFIKGSVSK